MNPAWSRGKQGVQCGWSRVEWSLTSPCVHHVLRPNTLLPSSYPPHHYLAMLSPGTLSLFSHGTWTANSPSRDSFCLRLPRDSPASPFMFKCPTVTHSSPAFQCQARWFSHAEAIQRYSLVTCWLWHGQQCLNLTSGRKLGRCLWFLEVREREGTQMWELQNAVLSWGNKDWQEQQLDPCRQAPTSFASDSLAHLIHLRDKDQLEGHSQAHTVCEVWSWDLHEAPGSMLITAILCSLKSRVTCR